MLLDKVNDFEKSRSHNERLSSWLCPTINVLYAFSSTVGQGVGLVSLNMPTLPTIRLDFLFTDIPTCKCHLCWYRYSLLGEDLPKSFFGGVFNTKVYQAAKDVGVSEEALADLFDRIENFFKRLESYTEVPPTNAMADIIVKIMVEVLNIFAIATKEMKRGRASE